MFTFVFALALAAMVVTKLWLAARQIRHVRAHRDSVPSRFATTIPLTSHQRAADYTVALTRLAIAETLVGALLLLVLTLGGGIAALDALTLGWFGRGIGQQLALIASVLVISGIVDLPFDYARHFVIEERFGFNRMTRRLFFLDGLKSLVLGAAFGLPLIALVLWLMARAGQAWWLYAWLAWMVFSLAALVLFPTVIAPLFNKFEPLADASLRERIDRLLVRCGFRSKGLFVMDGSRRSAHGNAYFTGFGAAKRIVFFDTLLARLNGDEIEAVLAHELGHFKHRHLIKRLTTLFGLSLALLALLGWLSTTAWFYAGLHAVSAPVADAMAAGARDGLSPLVGHEGLALLLFFLALPVFTFFLGPIGAMTSRRHEFEADAFAASQTNPNDLVSALVKLYQDNASTLTPDPLYTAFYYSHPPAPERIGRLAGAA
ncbi:M48 family metallopeptidase [Chitinasiproducens palmae]|uniref:STE24 endopeptidase n=1 Tax=Chitinasiproducens palmae TaxID=1770053 RepID=A0A1H2PUN5_9BURK|nr:M48 family metallopeptidase [Chitinasiproducens palmae]SDV50904.1 STE24 endopeptidase [Chitinasiproducens palmae]